MRDHWNGNQNLKESPKATSRVPRHNLTRYSLTGRLIHRILKTKLDTGSHGTSHQESVFQAGHIPRVRRLPYQSELAQTIDAVPCRAQVALLRLLGPSGLFHLLVVRYQQSPLL